MKKMDIHDYVHLVLIGAVTALWAWMIFVMTLGA